LDTIRLCTGYRSNGKVVDTVIADADAMLACEPIYEEMPGWKESTLGVKDYASLPANARAYLERIGKVLNTPIDIISTGADRADTIILRDPFE